MADLVTFDGITQFARRPLTSDEVGSVQRWIPLLNVIIRRIPQVDARIASGDLDIAEVDYVAAEIVVNRFDAPQHGVTQDSQTVGPISHSQTFDKNTPAGLVLTDELRDMLMPIADAGVGSTRLQSGYFPPQPSPGRSDSLPPRPLAPNPEPVVINVDGGWV